MSAPASAPAGDAVHRLVEALAARYGTGEFPARAAAADIPHGLWEVAGVARPDAGSCGRWLRSRKGVVAGLVLANRHDRDGVSLWRLRGTEPATPRRRVGLEISRPTATEPAPAPPMPSPPEPPPAAVQSPWWSAPSAPPPGAGGAAGRDGGPWWELGRGVAP